MVSFGLIGFIGAESFTAFIIDRADFKCGRPAFNTSTLLSFEIARVIHLLAVSRVAAVMDLYPSTLLKNSARNY